MEQVTRFTGRYFSLAERALSPEPVVDCEARCIQLAKLIVDVFTIVGGAYDSNPEQMSIFILNLFGLWV